MKFTVTINQVAIIESGLDMDLVDAAIFDMLSDYTNSPACKKRVVDGSIFFNVPYEKVIDEMPLCGLKNKDSVYRRFKKLNQVGLINLYEENKRIREVWFSWGRNYDLLKFKRKTGFQSEQTDLRPDFHPDMTGFQSEQRPDGNPRHYNTNSHITNSIKKENENEFSDFAPASAQSGNSTVEEKEKAPLTPSSAAPRSPKNKKHFDDRDVARLLSLKEQVFFAEIIKNETWPKWLEYKKNRFKFEYDAADSAARIIRKLYTLSAANAETAAEIAGESRSNGWKGFFPIDKPNATSPLQKHQYAQPMSEMAGITIRK